MNIYNAPFYTQTQLQQLDESQVSYPFSDDYATYIGIDHQYQITEKALNEIDSNWKLRLTDKSPNAVNNFLIGVRRKFYLYAYTHSRSSNAQINYLIAKRGLKAYPNRYEYRRAVINAQCDLAFYLLVNGDLASISGVDVESMTSLSIDTIRYEERDYPQRYKQTMLDLGLAYYGRYKFVATGCGEEW